MSKQAFLFILGRYVHVVIYSRRKGSRVIKGRVSEREKEPLPPPLPRH